MSYPKAALSHIPYFSYIVFHIFLLKMSTCSANDVFCYKCLTQNTICMCLNRFPLSVAVALYMKI